MKETLLTVGTVAIAALGAGILGISAVLAEQEVSLDQVPAAVRATIQQHAGQGQIAEIEQETEEGQIVYDVEVVVDGKETEFQVSNTGVFLGAEAEEEDDDADTEAEDEEESIPLEQVPAAVQEAAAKALPDSQVGRFTREVEDGFVVFEASSGPEGAEHEVKLTEDGHVVESEEQVAPERLPAAVLAAVESRFPGVAVDEAETVQLTFYELEIKTGGEEQEIKVLANGRILEDDDED